MGKDIIRIYMNHDNQSCRSQSYCKIKYCEINTEFSGVYKEVWKKIFQFLLFLTSRQSNIEAFKYIFI